MKSLMQAVLRTTRWLLLLGVVAGCGGSDDDTTGPPDDGLGRVPELRDPLDPSPGRGTILNGNSTGIHECFNPRGGNRYSHYEAPVTPGGPQLHIVGVIEPDESSGQGNHIKVHLTRAGSTILVLSSDQNAAWDVTVEPGVSLERVILNGYSRQTATVPAGVPLDIYSKDDSGNFLGSPQAYAWPSHHSTDLVNAAEELTGATLTSFRGCSRGTSFQIDEPGDIAPPHPVSDVTEPTPLDGCEEVTSESTYCMTMEDLNQFENRAALRMAGIDSGTMCGGELRADLTSQSLGWEGDYLYECWQGHGIARVSVLDGTTDVAPIPCLAVTTNEGRLYAVVDSVSYPPTGIGSVAEFASFDKAARREPERVFGVDLFAEAIAVHENRVYLTHLAQEGEFGFVVNTAELVAGAPITRVPLEYNVEFIFGIDVLDDGRLALLGQTSTHPDGIYAGIYLFDAETGEDRGAVSSDQIDEEGTQIIYLLQGLKCVSADP